MPRWTLLLFVVFASWALRGTLRAELAWEQKSLSFQPTVADTEVTAHFKFWNTGNTVVTIRSVTAACSCTTACASQPSYASGAAGEIVAKFVLEDRVGLQKMEIAVDTGDAGRPPEVLTMEVTVPGIAALEPDPLRWLPGEPLQAKRIRLIPARGVTLKPTAVTSSHSGVSVRIEAGAQPGQWELVVTPRADVTTFAGSLRIETDFPKEHPKTLLAHVQVAR